MRYGKFHQPNRLLKIVFFLQPNRKSQILQLSRNFFLSLETPIDKKVFLRNYFKIGQRENGFSAVFATISSPGIHAPESVRPMTGSSSVVLADRTNFQTLGPYPDQ